MAKRFYDFEQFTVAFINETQKAEAAILEATNRKLWMDIFSSNYLTEEEKTWFTNYLVENNIEADVYNLNESVWDSIKKGIQNIKDSKVGKAIADKVGKAIEGAKQFANYVGDLLKKAWDKLIAYFKNKFKGFKETIKKDYEKAKGGGKDITSNIKEELINLKDTTGYWTVEVPKNLTKTITGKFTQEIVKECLSYNGEILSELCVFDPKKMDKLIMEAVMEADDEAPADNAGGEEKPDAGHGDQKGLFGFLNKMAHSVAKFPPFSWLTKIKELGTAGAKYILKGFSKITKNMGGPGVFEFAVISLIAGGALELYLKHKAAELLDKGIEDVIGAEPVLKMIPMAKTIIHSLELVALFLLVVESVAELADLEGEIETAH